MTQARQRELLKVQQQLRRAKERARLQLFRLRAPRSGARRLTSP